MSDKEKDVAVKEKELVAIDMANGMTYIGEYVDNDSFNTRLRNVVVMSTISDFPQQQRYPGLVWDRIEKYKERYTSTIEKFAKEKIKPPTMAIDKTKIIAKWYL